MLSVISIRPEVRGLLTNGIIMAIGSGDMIMGRSTHVKLLPQMPCSRCTPWEILLLPSTSIPDLVRLYSMLLLPMAYLLISSRNLQVGYYALPGSTWKVA